jgi:hypothetical protein
MNINKITSSGLIWAARWAKRKIQDTYCVFILLLLKIIIALVLSNKMVHTCIIVEEKS